MEIANKLKQIKSNYILKKILSLLVKNKFYDLIHYNKEFQKKFFIGLEDYRIFSGKILYIDNTGHEIEKALNSISNKIIFEGEYLNRKKNGKGIKYNDYGRFEGEYLNGICIEGKGFDDEDNMILEINKDGKGQEYYNNGKKQFEGEYRNGFRWDGKGYNYQGEEIFEIKNGKGKIKEFSYYGKLMFDGEYNNGRKNGFGKEYTMIKVD